MWLTAVAQSSIALSDSSMIYSQELEGFLGRTKSIFIGSTLPVPLEEHKSQFES